MTPGGSSARMMSENYSKGRECIIRAQRRMPLNLFFGKDDARIVDQ